MPWNQPPTIDFDFQEEFHWPSWKVGISMDELFGDLHQRFNTVPMFIQNPRAFHCDVAAIAHSASDQADFYARLQRRRDERLKESIDTMDFFNAFSVRGHFDLHMNQSQHSSFFNHIRDASLDSAIAFFASFLGPNTRGELPNIDNFLSSESLKRKYGHILKAPGSGEIIKTQGSSGTAAQMDQENSDSSETDLDDGEQVLGFMRRRKKRARPAERVDGTSHQDKRQRTSAEGTCAIQDANPVAVANNGTFIDAATQTDDFEAADNLRQTEPERRPTVKGKSKRRRAPPHPKSRWLSAGSAQTPTGKKPDDPSSARAARAQRRAENKTLQSEI